MRVMVVVPSFAPSHDRHPKTVGRLVASGKPARTPGMGCRIHQPGAMQAEDGAEENSPENHGPAANGQKNQPGYGQRHVVIFGDPDVELVFSQVWDVASQGGGV